MTRDVEHRVLVLDGDAHVRTVLERAAEALAYEVRVTTRFARFLHELESWHPTHVALDLELSAMDGIEVMRHLAGHGFAGRVLITSDMGDRMLESARLSALAFGLRVDTLPRPLITEQVRGLLVAPADQPLTLTAGDLLIDPLAATLPVDVTDLERALDAGDIGVWYQPKVVCATGAPVGFEALARWHHAHHGVIGPATFIPIAEAHGLIDRLTDAVFEQALTWFGQHLPSPPLVICLNLSARSLEDIGLVERVEGLCRAASVDPRRVVLELTETSSVRDQSALLEALTRFRISGLSLALDDFGSGHSSLVQLARQPFTELKIDRSFVRTVARSTDSYSIIKAIVGLGHSLDLRVIAEGVEDAASYDAIVELGCDMMQGHFIAPPMEGVDALEWVEARYPPLLRPTTRTLW